MVVSSMIVDYIKKELGMSINYNFIRVPATVDCPNGSIRPVINGEEMNWTIPIIDGWGISKRIVIEMMREHGIDDPKILKDLPSAAERFMEGK